MLPKERQEIILKKIDEEGIVYLSELTKELQASTCTIRRDFDKLESDHLVKRIHGGAVKVQDTEHILEMTKLNMDTRMTMHPEEKRALCQEIARLVKDDDCIFIDGGTTFMYVMDYLQNKNVIVVSHNCLLKNDDTYRSKLYVLGGLHSSKYQMNLEPMTIDDLRYFHFDKVFIGAAGFTLEDQNIYTAEIETAKVKQQAMKQGKKKYLVIDSEKIGMYGFYTMANLKDMDGLITTQNIMSLQDKLILASNLESRK